MSASTLLASPIATTVGLLIASNVFMTFAWYGHKCEILGIDA